MARVAAVATVFNNTTGNHTAAPVVAGSESGHVYVSYDNTQVTSASQLRNLFQATMTILAGQLKP